MIRILFWLCTLLIAYGSLFPFDFVSPQQSTRSFAAFLSSWNRWSSRGDILSNFVLFVPFGFLGVLALWRERRFGTRGALLLLFGVAFAVALQFGQLLLPGRNPELQDGLWNGLGIVAGITLARWNPVSLDRFGRQADSVALVAALLIVAWLAALLIPFVPTLDWQAVKNAVKPLLSGAPPDAGEWLEVTVGWLVCLALWQSASALLGSDGRLVALIPLITLGQVFVVMGHLSSAELAGAGIALIVWFVGLREGRWRHGILLTLVYVTLAYRGLQPFEPRHTLATFSWLPFTGFLNGSMLENARVLCEKFFLFGSALWLARLAAGRWLLATTALVLALAAIEIAQIWLGPHTPETTDPLMALVIALLLRPYFDLPAARLGRTARGGRYDPAASA